MKTDNLIQFPGRPDIDAMFQGASRSHGDQMAAVAAQMAAASTTADLLMRSATRQAVAISQTHNKRAKSCFADLQEAAESLRDTGKAGTIADSYSAYLRDAFERWVLTMDALRERGDIFIAHEAAGCPPVLAYDYEVIVRGSELERPCNYELLRIVPPKGVTVLDNKRPYVIIDPRAGHGGGIGGFKLDSQVGVALADGHPVYFVNFRRMPEPGQTLADVTRAEAAFVREVIRRHPDSPKPVIAGNCQGGWATLLLAAANPDLTGPLILNGSPVAPWSGEVGTNPMRYNGGILGGAWQPMFWSDLGGGIFDGAHLVMNFEQLNPSRNYFGKYYDLFASVDHGKERFLEFERWWGGFFLLNEPEIRWIVEQLFVGNKLVKNTAQLEAGRPVDLKKIRAPIIVFTSHGDNITPPQQALNWIVDSYADVEEIRIRGQRIIYMLHDDVGHLGIFVSSKIAKREHTEMASTMKTIEALAPGLYQMVVDDVEGEGAEKQFTVSFAERSLDDIRAIDDAREDEQAFGAVARMSEMQAEYYDVFVRPWVRAMITPQLAEIGRSMHPLRVQRSLLSSQNPAMQPIKMMADQTRKTRTPLADADPFRRSERVMADVFGQSIDMTRDLRDALYEMIFFGLWSTPWAQAYGKPNSVPRTLKKPEELRALPEVEAALMHIRRGGFVEAVIRMLVLLADSRGTVRRDRLERSARVLTQDQPFKSMSMDMRARTIYEQTLVATFAPDDAIASLPDLLPSRKERELAAAVVQYVPGRIDEMAPHTLALLQRFRETLGLKHATEDVLDDPLGETAGGRPTDRDPGVAAE